MRFDFLLGFLEGFLVGKKVEGIQQENGPKYVNEDKIPTRIF